MINYIANKLLRLNGRMPVLRCPFVGDASGQITVEYFLIFTAVALVTVIGVTTFHTDVRDVLLAFFEKAANDIAR